MSLPTRRPALDRPTLERRLAAIRERMADAEIDCLVVVGRGNIAEFGAQHYLSGYTPVLRNAATIVALSGEPILAVTTPSDIALSAGRTPLRDVRVAAFGSAPNSLAALIAAMAGEGTVGVVGLEDVVPAAEFARWVAAAPAATFVDGADVLMPIKMVKSADDIVAMQHAGRTADEAFEVFTASLRDGKTLAAAAGDAEAALRASGAHEILVYASPGPHFLHRPDGVPPRDGDLLTVFVEFSDPDGYWVELARLVTVGTLGPDQIAVAAAAVEAIEVAGAALRPGRAASEAFADIAAVLRRHGVTSGLWAGHGVGIDHDLPVIGGDDPTPLAAGMVVALHPHIVTADGGVGACLCDTFVIGEEGTTPLSRLPRTPVALAVPPAAPTAGAAQIPSPVRQP
ncbi:Xaa-Pro peptidase family protein [Acuticoccus sp. I52.16.1]|uniref:M24 family metallopeptidase n=1 Tax=Acuticoccus sp. I52.16.1 TaxID=2928472 RepID=UPI001FD3FB07|nr:M24 family metallopeptidase [Acuticoccus sp. I52.16.1]UOM36579.1 M24 family metallopeptidase [Acuticoccus sp. I52.16.1]